MYKNIGGKIKNLAKGVFVVESIGAFITGVALATDVDVLYLLIAIGGPLVAWVFSWALYAFGELVEDVHDIRCNPEIANIARNVQLLATPIIKEKEENTRREAKARVEARAKREKINKSSSGTYWVCERCNTQNSNERTDCWSCGNPK